VKLAALFSGGKDSTFAMYIAKKEGHEITCLLTILPKSEESHLLHYPNSKWTKLQAESMNIPQITKSSHSDETNKEIESLDKILLDAKKEFKIEGLVHGGISSNFQKEKFESLSKKHAIEIFSPLWNSEPSRYMKDLLNNDFEFVITSVSSEGLDNSWLGKKIGRDDIAKLSDLAQKYGFNLNFEGGEAETFVINCPLFEKPIKIIKGKTTWDGYRGRFEIVDAGLNYNA